MSVEKAAKGLISKAARCSEGLLNKVEMAFRAYDPCFGCATHAQGAAAPISIRVWDRSGRILSVARSKAGVRRLGPPGRGALRAARPGLNRGRIGFPRLRPQN